MTLKQKINNLKQTRKAIIVAHNYQLGEVQDIADFVGDSLELSQKASKTSAEVIVFCGVHFMAETAAILSPEKTVLLPALESGCPMADMIDVQGLIKKKKEYPQAKVVCYVNSSAEVKAESDICCTSSNALKVLSNIPKEQKIIFVPDQYLGAYLQSQLEREMIFWPGFCPTHLRILPQHIERRKKEFPKAKVIVHPECRPEVSALADKVLSTGGMCKYCKESKDKEFIIGTEIGIIHRLAKENPEKLFIPATEQAICPNMKLITMENILWALEEMKHKIEVPPQIRIKAKRAVQRMVSIQ
jgi:quinolinate synthase